MNESVIILLSYAIKQYGMDRIYSLRFAIAGDRAVPESPAVRVYEDRYSESVGLAIAELILVDGAIEKVFENEEQ